MITVALERNNPSLGTLVDMTKDGVVIVTRGDKPILAFVPVSEDDIKTWRLGENPQFLALMQHSWERMQVEGAVSLSEARRRLVEKG